jgi:hypothetical protein
MVTRAFNVLFHTLLFLSFHQYEPGLKSSNFPKIYMRGSKFN